MKMQLSNIKGVCLWPMPQAIGRTGFINQSTHLKPPSNYICKI